MANIKVDHSKFETAASSIENYIYQMQNKMFSADAEIAKLSTVWQGSDFNQFDFEWKKISNEESVYIKMKKSLESYAKDLRYAANKYKDAQANAINRANNLTRW